MVNKKKKNQTKILRPPVVALMGHVDHGKTTLLDAIRKTKLTEKEAGGITQHVNAYKISFKKKEITFIDTPGHAAFAEMRSQGTQITDIAVLVVAANDGVKPQTKESLQFIRKAKIPFLVAVNKIDLPEANPKKVKNELAEIGVLVEGYGGQVVSVDVSAKQKKNIDELLEMILLVAEMEELKTNPKANLNAVVIDSFLDKKKGPLATVIVRNGTLQSGQKVFTAKTQGKIKALFNSQNKRIKKAEPGTPAQILGFKNTPAVGAKITEQPPKEQISPKKTKTKPDKNKLKIILKADTQAMLEAIENSLSENIHIVTSAVGQVTKSDVLMAVSTQSIIYAFNVNTTKTVKKLARLEEIVIKSYEIIYKLLEDLQLEARKISEPRYDEQVLGEAKIIAEFNIKGNHIAGCKITKGEIDKKNPVHIQRDGEIIADAKIKSYQKETKTIEKASKGEEIAIVFAEKLDFQISDVIISYNKKRE